MSTQRRRVLENGGLTDGVYIEGLNGKFYTVGNWQGGNDANSIVVASGDVKFRIAVTQQSTSMHMSSSSYDPLEKYMTAISGETEAKADYDGAGNTAKILQMQPSAKYVAGYCNVFIFPDGKTKGYLPSLGQLNLAYQNKAAVEAALSKCGGTNMYFYYHWSSTFLGVSDSKSRCCWLFHWGYGNAHSASLSSNMGAARPFADLS